jgi:hypothetical protein
METVQQTNLTKAKHPSYLVGKMVKTTKTGTLRTDWADGVWEKRQWGVNGRIVARHDSHGICYDVKHEDGSIGSYDPSELEPEDNLLRKFAMLINGITEEDDDYNPDGFEYLTTNEKQEWADLMLNVRNLLK